MHFLPIDDQQAPGTNEIFRLAKSMLLYSKTSEVGFPTDLLTGVCCPLPGFLSYLTEWSPVSWTPHMHRVTQNAPHSRQSTPESLAGSWIHRSGSPWLFLYLLWGFWASGTDHLWPLSSVCLSVDIWTHCADPFASLCSCVVIWIVINYIWPSMMRFLAERSTRTGKQVVRACFSSSLSSLSSFCSQALGLVLLPIFCFFSLYLTPLTGKRLLLSALGPVLYAYPHHIPLFLTE